MTIILRSPKRTPSRRGTIISAAMLGGILFSAFFPVNPLTAQFGRGQSGQRIQIPNPSTFPQPAPQPDASPRTTEKQKEALVKYNFKQMKKHADQLAELAQTLQKKIGQSNQNVLSLDVVKNAEEIEKLAKKIKNEAKGY